MRCEDNLSNISLLHLARFNPRAHAYRYYELVRDVRQNKGSILKASVEYIRRLKGDLQKRRDTEERLTGLVNQNKELHSMIRVRTTNRSIPHRASVVVFGSLTRCNP